MSLFDQYIRIRIKQGINLNSGEALFRSEIKIELSRKVKDAESGSLWMTVTEIDPKVHHTEELSRLRQGRKLELSSKVKDAERGSLRRYAFSGARDSTRKRKKAPLLTNGFESGDHRQSGDGFERERGQNGHRFREPYPE